MNKLPLFKVNMNQQALVDLAPVFSSGYIGEGPKVKEFEEEFYKINSGLPVKPLFVNSCTSAIVMALKLAGVGPGDEVISTPETCLGYSTPVLLANGSTKTIKWIVDNKYAGEVMSYNLETKKLEPQKITNWIKTIPTTSWYRLSFEDAMSSNNTQHGSWITGDHKVLTKRGWIRVDSLLNSDYVLTKHQEPNEKQKEFFMGNLLGDGSIRSEKPKSSRANICYTASSEEYLDLLSTAYSGLSFTKYSRAAYKHTKPSKGIAINNTPYILKEYSRWYLNNKKCVPKDLKLTDLTLCTWYLDDGSYYHNKLKGDKLVFCTDSFSLTDNLYLIKELKRIGFTDPKLQYNKAKNSYRIKLNQLDRDLLFEKIKYLVPECFQYKLAKKYQGYFNKSFWNIGSANLYWSKVDVKKLEPKSRLGRHQYKFSYCIEVANNNNFVASNMVVHNCSASNTAVLQHYAKVVWADVDPLTGLIDPEDVKKKITSKTKAIIGVDWGGRHCDYNKLKSYGLPVIQDAAHCLYVDSNNHGTYVCWSFGAIKFLCTVDGGALMVPETQYEEARLLRWFGLDREGSASFRCAQDIKIPGSKFQQNDVSATIGLANIPNAKTAVAASRENAREYYLSITNPKLQLIPFDNKSNYWIYTLLTKDPLDRDRLIGYLAERGIESSQVHARNDKHTVFKESKTHLPNTTLFDSSQLAIPNGFWITEKDRMYIVDTLNNFN